MTPPNYAEREAMSVPERPRYSAGVPQAARKVRTTSW